MMRRLLPCLLCVGFLSTGCSLSSDLDKPFEAAPNDPIDPNQGPDDLDLPDAQPNNTTTDPGDAEEDEPDPEDTGPEDTGPEGPPPCPSQNPETLALRCSDAPPYTHPVACDADGACTFACNEGARNLNGDLEGDGCECIVTEPEENTCDGIDNDCDGSTDETEHLITGICTDALGVCKDAPGSCQGGQNQCGEAEFAAHAGPLFEGLNTPELFCDGMDNNCDGATDEHCCLEALTHGSAPSSGPDLTEKIFPDLAIYDRDSIATGGSTLFFAWQENPVGNEAQARVWLGKASSRETTLEAPISQAARGNVQLQPSLALGAETAVVAWISQAALRNTIEARRWNVDANPSIPEDLQSAQVVNSTGSPKELRVHMPQESSLWDSETALISWVSHAHNTCFAEDVAQEQDNLSCLQVARLDENNQLQRVQISSRENPTRIQSHTMATGRDRTLYLWHRRRAPHQMVWRSVSFNNSAFHVGDRRSFDLHAPSPNARPRLEPTPDGFALLYKDVEPESGAGALYLKRLNHQGALQDEHTLIHQSESDIRSPQVLSLQDRLAILWFENENLFLTSISHDGTTTPIKMLNTEENHTGPFRVSPVAERRGFSILAATDEPEGGKGFIWYLFNQDGERILCPE